MPAIIFPGRAARGDYITGPVTLNSNSRLAQGVLDTWLFNGAQSLRGPGLANRYLLTQDATAPALWTSGYGLLYSGGGEKSTINITLSAAPYTVVARYRTYLGGNDTLRMVAGQSNNWLIGPYSNLYQAYNGGFFGGTIAPSAGREVIQVVTDDGTTATHYLNGLATGTRASATHPGAIGLGRANPFGNNGDGYMRQLVFYSRCLNAAEVWALYNPATRWDLYWVPGRRVYVNTSAAAFKPAWASGSNQILGGGTL